MLPPLLRPGAVLSWRQLKTVQVQQSLHDRTPLGSSMLLPRSMSRFSHSSSSLFSQPFWQPHISLKDADTFFSPCPCSIQVLHDLLQKRVQTHVHLPLLQQLDEVDVVGDDLAQIGHLLEQLGKQLQRVWVADLQLQLQRVKHRLLETLDGLHVQQAGTVWVKQVAQLLRMGQGVNRKQ